MGNKGIYRDSALSGDIACELLLQHQSLYIYLQDAANNLVIWNLRSLHCRLSGGTLHVSSAKGQSLECSGDMAQAIYGAWLAKEDAGAEAPQKKIYWPVVAAGLAVIGLIAFCLLLYVVLLPWLAEKSVALVPAAVEVQLGAKIGQALLRQETPIDSATFWAGRFMQHLKAGTTYPLRVQVIRSPELNAYALPGGQIVIYSGLLSKMSAYPQLAALIGHEAAHVTGRHALRSLFRSAGAGLFISVVAGDVAGISTAVLAQADRFRQLGYSRQLETEADEQGLKFLARNRIDPAGMLQLLELLAKESTRQPALMKYLGTHPETGERISAIAAQTGTKAGFAAHAELERIFRHLQRNLEL